MLFLAPVQESTVTIRKLPDNRTEYIVKGAQNFRVEDKSQSPTIATSVSRDGTLWIVRGEPSAPVVRVVNPKLKIETGAYRPLVLSPFDWWDSRSANGTPSPAPSPSPAKLDKIQALTPGEDAASGYSGVLRIPHEDGSRTEVLLVQDVSGKGHTLITSKILKGEERTPFFEFANRMGPKLRLGKPSAPNFVRVTVPGTRYDDSARLTVRVVDSDGTELAYVLGPALSSEPDGRVQTRIYNRIYSRNSSKRG